MGTATDQHNPRVFAEKVAIVYEALGFSLFMSAIASFVVAWVVSGLGNALVVPWLVTLNLVSVARWMLIQRWKKHGRHQSDQHRWANAFGVGAAATGTVWGMAGPLLFPPDDLERLLTWMVIMIAAPAISLATMVALKRSYVSLVVPFVGPFIIWSLFLDPSGHVQRGVGSLLYLIVLLGIGNRAANAVHTSISRRIAFEDLAVEADRQNELIRETNRDLEEQMRERNRAEFEARDQEQRLRQLIVNTPLACVGWDLNFRITSWNPAAEQIFGHTTEHAIGQDAIDLLVPPEYRAATRQGGQDWLASGKTFWVGLIEQVRADGRPLVCEWYTAPIISARGIKTEIISLVVDRTEQRAADRALLAAKQRLDLALDSSANTALWDWDLARGTIFFSHHWGRLLQSEAVEVTNPVAEEVERLHSDDRPLARAATVAAIKGEAPIFEAEYRVRRSDGEYLWMFNRGRVVERDDAGRAVRMIGTSSDITVRRNMEEALREAKTRAEDANVAKSQFLARMSHEIRTPMNGIIGMTELLLRSGLGERQARYAGTVQQSAQGLLAIINDILDFSKVEAGRMDMEQVSFDPGDIVEEVAQLFSERANSKGVALYCQVLPQAPRVAMGDPLRVRQVISNLVGNAVKFTSQGHVAITLTADRLSAPDLPPAPNGKSWLCVSVADTGPGIDAASRERLFQPFTQADGSTTRKFGGTGLGLAICRQLVDLMGGRIDVVSRVDVESGATTPGGQGADSTWTNSQDRAPLGHGSTFKVWLPIAIDADSVADQHPLSGRRVLLVEPDDTQARILMQQVEALGALAEHTPDGASALQRLHQGLLANTPYSDVLASAECPIMNGAVLATVLRSSPQFSATRIVLLASHASALSPNPADAVVHVPLRRNELENALCQKVARGTPPESAPPGRSAPAVPQATLMAAAASAAHAA